MEKTHKIQLGAISMVAILALSSIAYLISMQPLARSSDVYEIKNFGSYAELTQFLRTGTGNTGNYYWLGGFDSRIGSSVPNAVMEQDTAGDGGKSIDYSQTNIQVAGVDEPDIVKTDGSFLYIISNNNVVIVRAYPPETAEIVSILTFNSTYSLQNLFISKTRLVVFAQNYEYPILYKQGSRGVDEGDTVYTPWYSSPDTLIMVYDLTDIVNPQLIKEVTVGGYFSAARLIDDYVYVITTQYTGDVYALDESDSIIPRLLVNEAAIDIPLSDIYYVDIPEKSSTLTYIVSMNVHDDMEDIHQKIYLLGTSQTVYVSNNNIYVTYSMWYYNYLGLRNLIDDVILPMLPAEAQNQLVLLDTLSLDEYQKQTIASWIIQNFTQTLSENQKQQIVTRIVEETERSIIHRIHIDNGDITYVSQGSVPGYINNQFSLSEYDGYFRVSTTIQGTSLSYLLGSVESTNNVYVLDMNLSIVGKAEGLARGEQIYATRFIGTNCYLVTFRQVDPFFVIDLSNPLSPEVLGQVKIPGYSTYLHPYDDTHIIGIGRDNQSVKISLFDVSDMRNPLEVANYLLEKNESDDWWWTESTALYEHHAFLFSKEKNLLVIPAGNYGSQSAYVFDIGLDRGIELKGVVEHDYEFEKEDGDDDERYYWYGYGNSVQRTLYIENTLYSVSTNMVKMNDLATLALQNSVVLVETP